jgi:hypothetical protein
LKAITLADSCHALASLIFPNHRESFSVCTSSLIIRNVMDKKKYLC